MSEKLITALLDDAFSELQHDTGEQDPEWQHGRKSLAERFRKTLRKYRAKKSTLDAAAPELYQAAKMLEDLMTNHGEDFQISAKCLPIDLTAFVMIEKFKAAISKAEGRE